MDKNGTTGNEQTGRHGMLDMLVWYRAAGVDLCVTETPRNHFEARERDAPPQENETASRTTQSGKPEHAPPPLKENPSPKPAPVSQPGIDIMKGDPDKAATLAKEARTLDALKERLENLEECALRERATQLVFCDGNREADIMLIGKAPGREEDLAGYPFAGKTGTLLDRMLEAIQLDRNKVYLANIVPWRPPGSRDPTPHEIAICLPFLLRQIELVAPRIVLSVGELATRTLLDSTDTLLSLRGKWHVLKTAEHETKLLATLHPEFLLRHPAQKRQAWQDLQMLKKGIDSP